MGDQGKYDCNALTSAQVGSVAAGRFLVTFGAVRQKTITRNEPNVK